MCGARLAPGISTAAWLAVAATPAGAPVGHQGGHAGVAGGAVGVSGGAGLLQPLQWKHISAHTHFYSFKVLYSSVHTPKTKLSFGNSEKNTFSRRVGWYT